MMKILKQAFKAKKISFSTFSLLLPLKLFFKRIFKKLKFLFKS
jgi:hypothetical protein